MSSDMVTVRNDISFHNIGEKLLLLRVKNTLSYLLSS
jgi:hypothetical protein